MATGHEYNTYQQEYIDAMLLYNSKRLNALNSDDAAAVQDWALNASLYRQKVSSAYGKWGAAGYKHQVDGMRAYINQVTQRNLLLLKEDLQEKLNEEQLREIHERSNEFRERWRPDDIGPRESENDPS